MCTQCSCLSPLPPPWCELSYNYCNRFFLLSISARMPESPYQLKSDLVTHFLKRLYHRPSLSLKGRSLKMAFIQHGLTLFSHCVLTLDSAPHTPVSCRSPRQAHCSQACLFHSTGWRSLLLASQGPSLGILLWPPAGTSILLHLTCSPPGAKHLL